MSDREPAKNDALRWGEDLERDCQELRRLESWGLYVPGHHDRSCPLDHTTPNAPERTGA